MVGVGPSSKTSDRGYSSLFTWSYGGLLKQLICAYERIVRQVRIQRKWNILSQASAKSASGFQYFALRLLRSLSRFLRSRDRCKRHKAKSSVEPHSSHLINPKDAPPSATFFSIRRQHLDSLRRGTLQACTPCSTSSRHSQDPRHSLHPPSPPSEALESIDNTTWPTHRSSYAG